jgi:hypothetical protein
MVWWVPVPRLSHASFAVVGSPICGLLPPIRAAQPPSTRLCSVWRVDADRDDPSFEDGTGHVIGHFVVDMPVAGEAGVVPYVFVESVDVTLEKVVANDGEVATPPYREGDLRVATFRDPAGNVIGVWQQGSHAV